MGSGGDPDSAGKVGRRQAPPAPAPLGMPGGRTQALRRHGKPLRQRLVAPGRRGQCRAGSGTVGSGSARTLNSRLRDSLDETKRQLDSLEVRERPKPIAGWLIFLRPKWIPCSGCFELKDAQLAAMQETS